VPKCRFLEGLPRLRIAHFGIFDTVGLDMPRCDSAVMESDTGKKRGVSATDHPAETTRTAKMTEKVAMKAEPSMYVRAMS
jgi:hypothetical protein